MESDRELLELAAKAAGIELLEWTGSEDLLLPNRFWAPSAQCYWNPLIDDGDALRLAVKLELDIVRFAGHAVEATGRSPTYGTPGEYLAVRQKLDGDAYAATRRAIVRAAAEIGKTLG